MSEAVDVRGMLDASELSDIGFYEMTAVRGPLDESGERAIIGPGQIDDAEVEEAEHELGVYWTPDGSGILVRLLATVSSNAGEVRVGAQAEYTLKGIARSNVSREVEQEFVNLVAVMAMAPYIRTAVSDMSGRLFGRTFTLATVRPGDISFKPRSQPSDPT